MADTKSEVRPEQLDVEHELPKSEDRGDNREQQDATDRQPVSASPSELEKVTAERDAFRDRAARAQADFENARKRMSREQQDFRDFALADALAALLPVLDSFDSAFQTPDQSPQEFRAGMDLIRRQLHDVLSRLGLSPVTAAGEPFDPRLHEALDTVDTDEVEDNRVVRELQRGYRVRDRLLRPARVQVARRSRR